MAAGFGTGHGGAEAGAVQRVAPGDTGLFPTRERTASRIDTCMRPPLVQCQMGWFWTTYVATQGASSPAIWRW